MPTNREMIREVKRLHRWLERELSSDDARLENALGRLYVLADRVPRLRMAGNLNPDEELADLHSLYELVDGLFDEGKITVGQMINFVKALGLLRLAIEEGA